MDDSLWLMFLCSRINVALILALRVYKGAGHCHGDTECCCRNMGPLSAVTAQLEKLQATLPVSWPSLLALFLREPGPLRTPAPEALICSLHILAFPRNFM